MNCKSLPLFWGDSAGLRFISRVQIITMHRPLFSSLVESVLAKYEMYNTDKLPSLLLE
jgi:hypothetical protein